MNFFIKAIRENNIDVVKKTIKIMNFFIHAIRENNIDVVKKTTKLNPNFKITHPRALDEAIKVGNPEMIEIIKKYSKEK